MPIRQWFYYDAVEALHDTPLSAEEVAPRGCRYDGQIMVFGRSIQVNVCVLCFFACDVPCAYVLLVPALA
jgi:hypothetical protein